MIGVVDSNPRLNVVGRSHLLSVGGRSPALRDFSAQVLSTWFSPKALRVSGAVGAPTCWDKTSRTMNQAALMSPSQPTVKSPFGLRLLLHAAVGGGLFLIKKHFFRSITMTQCGPTLTL